MTPQCLDEVATLFVDFAVNCLRRTAMWRPQPMRLVWPFRLRVFSAAKAIVSQRGEICVGDIAQIRDDREVAHRDIVGSQPPSVLTDPADYLECCGGDCTVKGL